MAANVRTNNDTGVHKVVHSLKVVKGGSRKQLIVRGTYFPRKIYVDALFPSTSLLSLIMPPKYI